MSTAQIDRLESLLSRIQENREKPRPARQTQIEAQIEAHIEASRPAMVAPAVLAPATPANPAREPLMPTPADVTGRDAMRPVAGSIDRIDRIEREAPRPVAVPIERERATITEERVHLPDRVSVPQRPAANRSMPEPRSSREPAFSDASTAGARKGLRDRTATPLEMAVEGELNRPAQPEPIMAPKPARAPTGQTEEQMPAAHVAMQASTEPIAPLSIEAEPVAEMGRPIAQVMSKHTMELDTTFGAMLKRSLSLRPH